MDKNDLFSIEAACMVKPFTKENIKKFIKFKNIKPGFDNFNVVHCLKKWNGYDIFNTYISKNEPIQDAGYTYLYLAKEGKLHLVQRDDFFDILDSCKLCPDDVEIKSFKFTMTGSYCPLETVIKYKRTKKYGDTIYYTEKRFTTNEVISNVIIHLNDKKNKFKSRIKSYLNEFIYDYYPNVSMLCDGESFELEITLSNGEKYKTKGYGYQEEAYYNLNNYLERIIKWVTTKKDRII